MLQKLLVSLAIGGVAAMAAVADAQPGRGEIAVRRAFYGSSEASDAGSQIRLEVTAVVAGQCDGKVSCSFKCSAHELKVYNPYPNHPKEWRVSFSCGDQASRTIVVSAGAQAALSCSSP
jgi:hypothetical protein